MPDLEVHPPSASITAGQGQKFGAFLNGQPVQAAWSLQPSLKAAGQIDPSGAYSSPRRILRARKVLVVARLEDGRSGSAVVELDPLSFWTHFTGTYLLSVLAAIVLVVTIGWQSLCPTCHAEKVRISPPLTTLGASQSQLFTANVPVRWSGPNLSKEVAGLYTAPSNLVEGQTQLIAKMSGKPQTQGSAGVLLSKTGSLSLQPSQATVTAGSSVDLTVVAVPSLSGDFKINWLGPALGTLTPTSATGSGSLTARFTVSTQAVDRPTTILVVAQTSEASPRIAGTWVTVRPASLLTGICEEGDEFNVGGLLFLLILMGAMGGIIHAVSSFAAYVGNREFLTSWVWWYIAKPFQGALVGLVVFLVVRAGFGIGTFSLDTADCLKSAAFAALIGLFAEPATIKLKDIFEAIFTPRNDTRRDAAGEVRTNGPTLISLDPSSVTVGQDIKSLTLHGTGFSADCQIKIGTSDLRKPTPPITPTMLTVPLKPEDISKPGKVSVVVFNKPPSGDQSNIRPLDVTEKKDEATPKDNPPGGAQGGASGGKSGDQSSSGAQGSSSGT